MINGPEGFTPDNEFILGESEVRGLLRGGRLLRPRHRRRRGDRSPGGQLDRRRRARARPLEDGHPPLRRPVPEPGVHPRPDRRGLLDLLRHPLPERGAVSRPTAPPLAHLRPAGRARRRLRREIRLGAPELVRRERGGGRRGAPAARLGGPALVAGDRRRGAGHPDRRRASSTSRASPRSRSSGRAPRPSSSGSARTTSTDRSARSSTPRCSTGVAASSATSRSPGWRATASSSSPGPPSATMTSAGSATRLDDLERADDGLDRRSGLRRGPDRGAGLLRPVGAAGARHPVRPARRRTSRTRRFPYLTARRITVGNVPVLALRVTYVGELGWELYPSSEYGAALWDVLWAAGREHGLVAGGYRAIDALRLEKGYRVWSSDITPDETPVRGGPRLRGPARQGYRLRRPGRPACGEGRRAAEAAPLSRPRRPALGRPGQRAGPGRRSRRRAGDQRRLRVRGRALDRLCLPAARPGDRRDCAATSRCSASGSASRSPPSRCTTPRVRGSAHERPVPKARSGRSSGRRSARRSRGSRPTPGRAAGGARRGGVRAGLERQLVACLDR